MSLHGGPAGDLGRGFFARDYVLKRLWKRLSLSIGALLRTWGEWSVYWEL
jgi:hypothetical protein